MPYETFEWTKAERIKFIGKFDIEKLLAKEIENIICVQGPPDVSNKSENPDKIIFEKLSTAYYSEDQEAKDILVWVLKKLYQLKKDGGNPTDGRHID